MTSFLRQFCCSRVYVWGDHVSTFKSRAILFLIGSNYFSIASCFGIIASDNWIINSWIKLKVKPYTATFRHLLALFRTLVQFLFDASSALTFRSYSIGIHNNNNNNNKIQGSVTILFYSKSIKVFVECGCVYYWKEILIVLVVMYRGGSGRGVVGVKRERGGGAQKWRSGKMGGWVGENKNCIV